MFDYYWVDFDGSIRIPAESPEAAFDKARKLLTRLEQNSDFELSIDVTEVEIIDYRE